MLIEALIKQSGMNEVSLEWLALTASKRYKTYEIPKRNGGARTIHHPSKGLKSIQRWISKFLLRRLPVHAAAQAYVTGASIKKNAELHTGSKFTLRVDFADFFPSFSGEQVEIFLAAVERDRSIGLTERDILFISRIVSRHGQLTIGAPSSPILTNAMMYFFDQQIAEFAERKTLTYSRYADDLFFSSIKPDNLSDVPAIVQQVSATYPYANLRVNPDKTAFLSKRYSRRITGLVLTTEGNVSIGRERKRMVKAKVHRLLRGELDISEVSKLCGYLAFVQDVEPEFWESLKRKYGADSMLTITGNQWSADLL